MKLANLTDMQRSALQEIGGIGAGHAATALSQLVDRAVALDVPSLEIVPLEWVPELLGGPERIVFAAFSRLRGEMSGGVMFVADREAALALVDLLHGRAPGATISFGETEQALLQRVAAALISAYVTAIGRMADLDVVPTEPQLAFEMVGALLEAAIASVEPTAEDAALVRARFVSEGESVESALLFAPDAESLKALLGRLNVL